MPQDFARFESVGCAECRNLEGLGFEFTMAFQPIVNVRTRKPFAYEALVRGVNGESAASILERVDDANRYRFDQACRVKAIERATALGLLGIPDCKLSINFLPKAVPGRDLHPSHPGGGQAVRVPAGAVDVRSDRR